MPDQGTNPDYTVPVRLPVTELIGRKVLLVLQTITVLNGYGFTIKPKRALTQNVPDHLLCLIYQDSPEGTDASYIETNAYWLPFQVVVHIMGDDRDTIPVDTYCNVIVADLTEALMADYTLGGLTEDLRVEPDVRIPPITGDDYAGTIYNFRVLYRTQLDHPYVNAVRP